MTESGNRRGRPRRLATSVTTVGQTREMFNLFVSEAHTYYVGNDGWLVHNVGSGGCPYLIDDSYHPNAVETRISADAAAGGGSKRGGELAQLGSQAITSSARNASPRLRSLANEAGSTLEYD